MCACCCRRRFCHLCAGSSRAIVSVEYTGHPHPVRGVWGCGGTAVCAGVLEKSDLFEYSDTHIRTWRGLFSGVVYTHCFPGGRIQQVSSPGIGTELHRDFPELSAAAKESEGCGGGTIKIETTSGSITIEIEAFKKN